MSTAPLCAFPRLTRRDVYCWLLLLAAVVFFNPAIFFYSHIPFDQDSLLFYYPLRALHQDEGLGFWNPYMFSGFPRDANPQSQMLYPANMLLVLFSTSRAYSLLLIGHLFLGGAGVYLLLRCLRRTYAGAFLAALAFTVSTFWRCKIANLGLLEGIAWLPYLLLFILFALEYRRGVYALIAAWFLALTIAAGMPQTVVYSVLLLSILAVFYIAANPKFLFHYVMYLVTALTGALLLSAWVWLPAFNYASETARTQLPLDGALVGALGWNELWRVFLGGLAQPEISRSDPWESTCYLGVTALLFIPFGWKAVPGRLRYGLTAALIFALLCTLGRRGWVFVWLYHYLPGWSFLNLPNRSLLIAAAILPIFIAFGLDRIRQRAKPSKPAFWLLTITAFAGLVALTLAGWQNPWAWTSLVYSALTTTFEPESISPVQWALTNFAFWTGVTALVMLPAFIPMRRPHRMEGATQGEETAERPPGRFAPHRLMVALLAALITTQSLQYSQRLFLQTTPPDYFNPPQVVERLTELTHEQPGRTVAFTPFIDSPGDVRIQGIQSTLAHRLPEVFQIHEIQGYDPVYSKRYAELLRAWGGQQPGVDPVRKLRLERLPPSLLDFLGVRYVVGYPNQHNLYRGVFQITRPDRVLSRFDEAQTIKTLSLRWLAAGAMFLPQGYDAGQVNLLSNGTPVAQFPIRMGQEIANGVVQSGGRHARHRPANLYRWFPIPSRDGYTRINQYRTVFTLSEARRVDAVEIEWWSSDASLVIQQIDYRRAEPSNLRLLSSGYELPLYENPSAFGPIYLSRQVIRYREVGAIVETFKTRGPNEALPVFLSHEQDAVFDSSPIGGSGDDGAKLSWERPHSDQIKIEVETPFDTLLVVHENYSPNWQVKIGRNPVEVIRANHAFMALPVSAGNHTITVTYVPKLFYGACSISGAALIVFVILIVMQKPVIAAHFRSHEFTIPTSG